MPIFQWFQKMLTQWRSRLPLVVSLILIMSLQAFCALFFLGDAYIDIAEDGFTTHMHFELLAVVSLLLGVLVGGLVIAHLFMRTTDAEFQLYQMRDTFTGLVSRRFRDWGLTASETEVAWLVLKGFEIAEIAEYRKAATGTVRAQLSRIYEKSQQPNRGRFVSQFLDPMLDTDQIAILPTPRATPAHA